MKKLVVMIAALLCLQTAIAQDVTHDAAIDKVLNTFMQSIIKKDTTALYALFAVNVSIAWVDVQGKATLAFVRKRNPSATMIESDSHTNFIRYVGKTIDAVEEKFYNIKLRKNENLASLSFDYSFWANNKKENWGQENWELVFDGTDWKIAGIYYSYELESVKAEPVRN